jgi:hypothetical protein
MSGIVQDPTTGSQENRKVNAFLRGPIVAGQSQPRFNLAVEAEVRNGVMHQAILAALPSPRDAVTNNFGVQTSGGFDATIVADYILPDTYSADGHWDGYSLVSLYGENPTAFTRNLPIPVPDHDGNYQWTLADEFAPAAGCRRVRNMLSDTETLATQSITVQAGTHILVLGKCSGSVTLSGVGSGTLAGSTANRKQLIFTATAGTLTVTVTGSVLQAMVVPMQGASYLVAPEYVPNVSTSVWPHAGFGVRGVRWFRTPNLNTVDASGNVTDVAATFQRQAWVYLPGRPGNFGSTPDAVANRITGDIDIRVRAVAVNYAPGANQVLVMKYGASPQWGYGFSISSSGQLQFQASSDGTTQSIVTSSVVIPLPNNAGGWFRVTRSGTAVLFYTSQDGLGWQQLGTAQVLGFAGAIFTTNGAVEIGQTLGAFNFNGRIDRAQILNGINGAVAVDFDANRFAVGATTAVMSTGETWTINTSGAGNVARIAEAFTDATQRPSYHTPQEANLITADINSWTETGTTVTTAATGPDGLLTAWTLTDNDGAAHEFRSSAITVANDSATRSVLVYVAKDAVTARFACVGLVYSGGTGTGRRVHIDTSTGALTVDSVQNAGSNSAAEDAGAWWGIRLAVANNSTGNTTMTVECYPAYSSVAGTANVAAQGSTTFAWPMAVLGARVAAYNPPGAGTRNEVVLQLPGSIINDAEGFVYAEYQLDTIPTSDKRVLGDSVLNRTPLYIVGSVNYAIGSYDGVNNLGGGEAISTAKTRVASAWSGTALSTWVNNVAQIISTNGYDGSWNGTSWNVGLANGIGDDSAPTGAIGPIKWAKKRPPTSYLTNCNASRDLFSRGDFDTIRDNSKGTTWELEILSQLTRANGSSIELTDVRRAVAKRISVTKNKLSLSFADIDTDALDRVYPSNKYSKEEFTNIYEGHIGRVVPDCSPGTLLKVPMAFINTNGTTTWTFAICERRTGPTYTVNTVYRDGRIVSASEYSVSTATATSGLVVVTVVFAREQRDTSGKQYEFTADITVSGTREPSTEIQRLLTKVGVPTDAASFTAAAAVDVAGGFYIDAAYTTEVQLKVIIEYLLQVARGDLVKTSTGAWAIVQDKVRASVATLREQDSLIDVESVEEPMPPRAYELKYRPRAPGSTDWQFTATRSGTGTAETLRIQNPYIYDGNVADRLIDYIAKRENTRRDAKLKVWGAMFDNGDVLTVTGVSCYTGNRDWLIRGVERPTDANTLTARQYDASIYTYGAGTIPAGASSAYSPDYSQTTPAAPTGLTYTSGSSGVTTSTDGTARAYMFYACTPPSVNYSRIVFQAVDATGGITRSEGKRNGAVFEAVLSGLRPGVSHTVSAYAINANGIEGATVSDTRNSPGYATAPGTPTMNASGQIGTKTVQFDFVMRPGSEMVDYYEAQISSNFGASWGTAFRVKGTPFEYVFPTVGTTYGARVRAVDKFGNAGSYSSGYFIATAKWADGNVIVDASINRSRSNTSTGSFTTASIAAGGRLNVGIDKYAFAFSAVANTTVSDILFGCSTDISKVGGADLARLRLHNNSASADTVTFDYRIFNT